MSQDDNSTMSKDKNNIAGQRPDRDAFLDSLYKQSMTETPPETLDQLVREDAQTHLSQRKNSKLFQWQRLTSVAAVMVIAIYLFFDINGMQEHGVLLDEFSPQPQAIQAPAPPEMETMPSVDRSEQAEYDTATHALKERNQLEQRQKKIEPTREMQPERKQAEQQRQQQGTPAAEPIAEPIKLIQPSLSPSPSKAKTTARDNSKMKKDSTTQGVISSHPPLYSADMAGDRVDAEAIDLESESPEDLLNQLTQLIQEEEFEQAENVYRLLVARYPNYVIPEAIKANFETSGERN